MKTRYRNLTLCMLAVTVGFGTGGAFRTLMWNENPTTLEPTESVPSKMPRDSDHMDGDTHSKDGGIEKRPVDAAKNKGAKNNGPSDLGITLEKILNQAGIEGLPPAQKSIVKENVGKWMAKDPDSLWQWTKSIGNHSSRAYIAGLYLEHLMDRDPDCILAKYRELRESDPDFKMFVGDSLMKEIIRQGNDGFLELLRLTPVGTRQTWGGTIDMPYPDDFDFAKVAVELRAISKANDGLVPIQFPADYLGNWAAKDFEGALRHTLDYGLKDIPCANWSSLLIAHERKHGRKKTDEWYRELILGDSGFRVLEGIIMRSNIGFERQRFSGLFPDSKDRDQIIMRYFAEAEYVFHVEDHWDGLHLLSTPEKRKEALRLIRKSGTDEFRNVSKDMARGLQLDPQSVRNALGEK